MLHLSITQASFASAFGLRCFCFKESENRLHLSITQAGFASAFGLRCLCFGENENRLHSC